ncbi:MAG: biopolymer transporter ExbD [Planctomycetota bacterium]|nr:biopolymer transporter ExbD [Planctomycetota bacterium]
MKLNKHDANTEMKMNMTPMIDVVFLLIIFFMIITDLTQQELEEIKLPVAQTCVPDEPVQGVVRPIVNIDYTGKMVVMRETYFDPETGDLKPLEGFLADQARRMPKEGLDKDKPIGPTNPPIPSNPLLIRADKNTEFKYIQKLMELCGKKGIQIWKIELAAAEPDDRKKDDK